MEYSTWSLKRCRQELATKQQEESIQYEATKIGKIEQKLFSKVEFNILTVMLYF